MIVENLIVFEIIFVLLLFSSLIFLLDYFLCKITPKIIIKKIEVNKISKNKIQLLNKITIELKESKKSLFSRRSLIWVLNFNNDPLLSNTEPGTFDFSIDMNPNIKNKIRLKVRIIQKRYGIRDIIKEWIIRQVDHEWKFELVPEKIEVTKQSKIPLKILSFSKFQKKVIIGSIVAGCFIFLLFSFSSLIPPIVQNVTPTTLPTAQQGNNPVPTKTISDVSLVPGPTEVPPTNSEVFIDVDKDALDATVSILLTGGPGLVILRDIDVILIRSDGTTLKGFIDPSQPKRPEIKLAGTKGTDRLKVTVNYYTGKSYIVIDRLLPYRNRG